MTGCAICAFIFGRRSAQFGLAIAIVISLAATAKAQTHSKYDDPNTAEGWSWLQIKLGLPADFGSKCGERLDPKGEDNPAYSDPKKCRTISASFIVNILTDSALRDSIGYNGVDIRNARIDGDVNLDSAKIDRALRIANSRFEGAISLGKAHAASALDLQGSLILGSLNAAEFQSESDFELDGTTIMGALDLGSAVIAGYADLRGTDCEGYFNADSFQVGKSLVMRSEDNNKASFKNVSMRGAKITGQIDMNGASFDGDLDADSLQVGGSLFMRSEDNNKASFKDVSMRGANIAGQVDMAGARFEGDLSADNLQVGQDLLMLSDENKASFNAVYLNSANVTGRLTMDGALFQRDLTADGLQVGGDVSMRDIYTDRSVEIRRAQLKGNLDLGGADLFNLNLRGTSIVGEMRLGDRNSIVDWLAPRDSHLDPRDILDLRDVHVGGLSDNRYSWPRSMHLAGFSFARVTDEMVARGSDWWKRWAGADEDGSFSPYEQLAAAFAAAGHNQGADDFRYYKYVLQDVESPSILSWPLRAIGGYGLRSYAARPLYWAFGLSLLGAVYLRFRVKGVSDAGHGLLWCLGASANQLLPSVINIKKEFKDFFDDPEKNQFTPWQDFVFVLFALSGLVIGGFVVAALTALGHAP